MLMGMNNAAQESLRDRESRRYCRLKTIRMPSLTHFSLKDLSDKDHLKSEG
jgi:hypothetical protein